MEYMERCVEQVEIMEYMEIMEIMIKREWSTNLTWRVKAMGQKTQHLSGFPGLVSALAGAVTTRLLPRPVVF